MKLYTVKEVAALLNTSKDKIYALIKSDKLKIVKIPNVSIRITEEALEELIKSHEN